MSDATKGAVPRREELSFFQQSGWMLLATGLAGICFAAVHVPAGRMRSTAEWALVATRLDSLYLLAIPAGGLQAVFAQMAAAAVTAERAHAGPLVKIEVEVDTLDQLLQHDIDGAVIATPSAMHAEQSMALRASGFWMISD